MTFSTLIKYPNTMLSLIFNTFVMMRFSVGMPGWSPRQATSSGKHDDGIVSVVVVDTSAEPPTDCVDAEVFPNAQTTPLGSTQAFWKFRHLI